MNLLGIFTVVNAFMDVSTTIENNADQRFKVGYEKHTHYQELYLKDHKLKSTANKYLKYNVKLNTAEHKVNIENYTKGGYLVVEPKGIINGVENYYARLSCATADYKVCSKI